MQCSPTCWLTGARELLHDGAGSGGVAVASSCSSSWSSSSGFSSIVTGTLLLVGSPHRTVVVPFCFLHRACYCLFVLVLSKTSILPCLVCAWRVAALRNVRLGYRCLIPGRHRSFFLSTASRLLPGPIQPLTELAAGLARSSIED